MAFLSLEEKTSQKNKSGFVPHLLIVYWVSVGEGLQFYCTVPFVEECCSTDWMDCFMNVELRNIAELIKHEGHF